MIGETILHYKIIEKIGAGGMGVVYKARDTKLDRVVALKFLPEDLLRDKIAKERFTQEAKSASKLDHPNICTIHAVEEVDDRLFIAMAYYEGETLQEVIDKGPMKIDEVLTITNKVADGLHEAHSKGIVHRDIKPSNIMLTDRGQVKIMDFGLAKSIAGSLVTKAGTTLGTIGFMSPEQSRGEEVDSRTDIWSLGVLLYYMLAGQTPFKGEYEQAIIYSILNTEPEPVTGVRTGVPVELENYIGKCLEKDREDRYPAVDGLIVDLRRLKKDTSKMSAAASQIIPVETAAAGPESVRKSADRGSTTIVIPASKGLLKIAFAAVAVITLAFFGRSFFMGEDAVPRVVVLPFENIGDPGDEFFASDLAQEIAGKLSAVNGLRLTSFSSARIYDLSGKTIQQIGTDLNADYILRGDVRWLSGGDAGNVRITPELIRSSDDTGIWSEIFSKTTNDIIELQLEITNNVIRSLNITISESEQTTLDTRPTENLEAYNLYLRGLEYNNRGSAEVSVRIALQSFQRAVELDPSFALAHAWLSRSHSLMYWMFYDRSDERRTSAKEAIDRSFSFIPGLPEAHVALGYYYYWGYLDYKRALEQFETARISQPNNVDLLSGIGYVQRRQGKMEESVANIKAAFDLDPQSGTFAYEVGLTYYLMRDYTEAENYINKAISFQPDRILLYGIQSLIYLSRDGNTTRARKLFEETSIISTSSVDVSYVETRFWMEIFDKNYREALEYLSIVPADVIDNQWDYIPFSLMYAQAYGLLADRQLEQENHETARQILETKVSEQPEDERFHSALGIAYAGLGLKEEAIREGLRGVELLPVEKEAWRGSVRVEDLAKIYTMVGEYEEAVDRIEYLLGIPGMLSVNLLRLDPVWDPLTAGGKINYMTGETKIHFQFSTSKTKNLHKNPPLFPREGDIGGEKTTKLLQLQYFQLFLLRRIK